MLKLTVFVVLCSTWAWANDADWAGVRALPAGGEVAVDTKAGPRVQGKLEAVSETVVVVKVAGRDHTVARGDVRKVLRRVSPRHRKRWMGLGAAAGFVAGFGASIPLWLKPCGRSDCAGEKATIAGLLVGLPVAGALSGRLLAGKGEFEIVYLAR